MDSHCSEVKLYLRTSRVGYLPMFKAEITFSVRSETKPSCSSLR